MIPHRRIHESEIARLVHTIRNAYGWALFILAFAGVGAPRRRGTGDGAKS